MGKWPFFNLDFGRERLITICCNNSWMSPGIRMIFITLPYSYSSLKKELSEENWFLCVEISPNLEKFFKFGVIFPVTNISPNLGECPKFEWFRL